MYFLPPPGARRWNFSSRDRIRSNTSSFNRRWLRASSQVTGRSFRNAAQAKISTSGCARQQSSVMPWAYEIRFQVAHGLGARAVRVGEEEPEIEEFVALGELLTNGSDGLV